MFPKHHSDKIHLRRPRKVEALRFKSCNDDTLKTSFAATQRIVTDHNSDKSCIYNLEKSGSEANREEKERINKKCVIKSNEGKDYVIKVPYFNNVNRVSVVTIVFDNGEVAPPLLIFEGKHIPYRTFVAYDDDNYRYEIEPVRAVRDLPNSVLVATR